MSFKYAHAGVYRCDESGCDEKLLSPTGDLPEGWTELQYGPDGVILHTCQHRCNACSRKVLAQPKS